MYDVYVVVQGRRLRGSDREPWCKDHNFFLNQDPSKKKSSHAVTHEWVG